MRIVTILGIVAAAVCVGTTATCAQDYRTPCERDASYGQLDFRLGTWNVHDENGKLIGIQRFEKTLDGCLNLESWEGQNGRNGKAFTFLDRTLRQWKRIYVDDQGNTVEALAAPSEDAPLAFESTTSSGARIRWTLVSETEQVIHSITERSRDDGKTWKIVSTRKLERAE